ncbi:MAG: hypothetical protein ACOX89_05270, partial [Lutispora sp.]
QKIDNESATKNQLLDIFSFAKDINMSNEDLKEIIVKTTGKEYTKDLTKKEAKTILNILTKIKNRGDDNLVM